jgi:hypothetical protein
MIKSLCEPDDDQKVSVHLTMAITEYIQNVYRAILNTVFENTFRRVNKGLETGGGYLNITCNFLYCNHQVHRDFLITLNNGDCAYANGFLALAESLDMLLLLFLGGGGREAKICWYCCGLCVTRMIQSRRLKASDG